MESHVQPLDVQSTLTIVASKEDSAVGYAQNVRGPYCVQLWVLALLGRS